MKSYERELFSIKLIKQTGHIHQSIFLQRNTISVNFINQVTLII